MNFSTCLKWTGSSSLRIRKEGRCALALSVVFFLLALLDWNITPPPIWVRLKASARTKAEGIQTPARKIISGRIRAWEQMGKVESGSGSPRPLCSLSTTHSLNNQAEAAYWKSSCQIATQATTLHRNREELLIRLLSTIYYYCSLRIRTLRGAFNIRYATRYAALFIPSFNTHGKEKGETLFIKNPLPGCSMYQH